MGRAGDAFQSQLRSIDKKMVAGATEAIRSYGLAAFHELRAHTKNTKGGLTGSPVASGRFAASMRLSINTLDASVAPADPEYRYPAGKGPRPLPDRTISNEAISTASLELRRFRLGDTIYISNSVPYVREIEINGHSWQTPGGVFTVTMDRVTVRFEVLNGANLG